MVVFVEQLQIPAHRNNLCARVYCVKVADLDGRLLIRIRKPLESSGWFAQIDERIFQSAIHIHQQRTILNFHHRRGFLRALFCGWKVSEIREPVRQHFQWWSRRNFSLKNDASLNLADAGFHAGCCRRRTHFLFCQSKLHSRVAKQIQVGGLSQIVAAAELNVYLLLCLLVRTEINSQASKHCCSAIVGYLDRRVTAHNAARVADRHLELNVLLNRRCS